MRYTLEISGKTDKGKKRSKNEDNFTVEHELGFMILADGMGGHSAGEVASQLATSICSDQLKRSLKTGHVPVFKHVEPKQNLDPRSLILGDCVKFSNQAVYEAAQSKSTTKKMGTTIVAALALDEKLAIAHVGDSRLYRFRDGELVQVTNDHSFIQEQIERGLIKPEEAEKSSMRNMLTRSVGVSDDVDVDVTEVDLDKGDFILICSDGLTKMLTDEQINKSFSETRTAEEIANELIARANEAGGDDNVTVIVARVNESKSNWSNLSSKVKKAFHKKDAK